MRPRDARLHQRHPDMRPVAVSRGAVAGHRYETARVGPDLEAIRGTEHHLEHRPSAATAQLVGITHSGWSLH